jgi:hypothetical protein
MASGASVAVLGAFVAGASVRLLLFPQFALGLLLVGASVVLKASRHAALLAALVVVAAVGAFVAFALRGPLMRELRRAAPAVARSGKAVARSGLAAASDVVSTTPPWAYSTLAFLLPALGQFLGSLATVRMLSTVDERPLNVPGAGYYATLSGVYLLSFATGGAAKSWMEPGKASFLLQSLWVLRALLSPAGRSLELWSHLPSVLAGWGSFSLSLTPAGALMSALKAGAASAAVAAAGVATVEGVSRLAAKRGSNEGPEQAEGGEEEAEREETEPRHSGGPSPSMDEEMRRLAAAYRAWLDEWQRWAQEALSPDAIAARLEAAKAQLAEALLAAPGRGLRAAAKDAAEPPEELTEQQAAAAVAQEASKTSFDVSSASPPMSVALPVALFRALPTCLTLVVALSFGAVAVARRQFKPGMVLVPLMLAPMAAGELLALVRVVGAKNLLLRGPALLAPDGELRQKYPDGLSVLLWQSPSMLGAWRQVRAVGVVDAAVLADQARAAPRRWLFPDSEAIAAAPPLDKWLLGKLLLSLLIDVAGMSSFAVPGLGELTDVVWAPLQGYLVQALYQAPLLSWISLLEELLPFTDWIPTATVGWLWTYGTFIPAWLAIARELAQEQRRKND